ncbi:MAG TPA: hypothetical protein VNR40_13875, partial [Steroidobacter sp.]|nr:hypothetical protein [Steroidobacter sp.]
MNRHLIFAAQMFFVGLLAMTAAHADKGMRPGTVFKDCQRCPELVVLPAGSFMMGSPEEEPARQSD